MILGLFIILQLKWYKWWNRKNTRRLPEGLWVRRGHQWEGFHKSHLCLRNCHLFWPHWKHGDFVRHLVKKEDENTQKLFHCQLGNIRLASLLDDYATYIVGGTKVMSSEISFKIFTMFSFIHSSKVFLEPWFDSKCPLTCKVFFGWPITDLAKNNCLIFCKLG